ncbi:MAG: glycerol kinase GlpK [Clostridia bacterium]|nr:glycerol kinase GlpK [Clostridia bacterium]
MNKKYILAVDLGTTSIRTLAYNTQTHECSRIARREVTQFYPHPGWVEQDGAEIVKSVVDCLKETTKDLDEAEIYGLGITNQRETVVAWDRNTGLPLEHAIVWQCRRTHDYCQELRKNKRKCDMIHKRTGLLIDSYFSATKMSWLLENSKNVTTAYENGLLCMGTLDSYLVFCLTNGKSFVTDHSNASRTLLYNLNTQSWDADLCEFFGVPMNCLAKIVNNDCYVGDCVINGKTIKIGGIIGDQQSSLFGQNCVNSGDFKTTYGTGAFMLANIGSKPVFNKKLITTVAWKTREGMTYALEGNMYSAGSCINWLKDRLNLIKSAKESESLAGSVADTGGVFFVPALAGLGAPFWKGNARAEFRGITLSSTSAHIVRAVLRGITYNTRAVYDCMREIYPLNQREMRVDGGMTANALVMQFQSDIMHFPVAVSAESESTSLGACYMAGLCFGAFKDMNELNELYYASHIYTPTPHDEKRESNYKHWLEIVENL